MEEQEQIDEPETADHAEGEGNGGDAAAGDGHAEGVAADDHGAGAHVDDHSPMAQFEIKDLIHIEVEGLNLSFTNSAFSASF